MKPEIDENGRERFGEYVFDDVSGLWYREDEMPSYQEGGEDYEKPYPKLDFSLVEGRPSVRKEEEKPVGALLSFTNNPYEGMDPSELIETPEGTFSVYDIMTPFEDEDTDGDALVVRGYPSGTKNTFRDIVKRAAEVQMRRDVGFGQRNFSDVPKDTWKYRQYILTGKGRVPNRYRATHNSWEEYDGPEGEGEGSDIIDLQLYGRINPSWNLEEDDDVAHYQDYIDKAYPDKKVRSFTYHPEHGMRAGEEEVHGNVTPMGMDSRWGSVGNIDTAHDYVEYGKDENGNIVARGVDALDYYPGDYTNLWGGFGDNWLNRLGNKAKSYIQSSLLNSVADPIIIKTPWGYPNEGNGDFLDGDAIYTE